ncbi:MAG: EamA family transporter [Lentisphaeria bacterium]|nr:EamA family transporter [Lentisphaeria bacterium]
MMTFGILSGIAAALFQSGGYIFARIDIKKGSTPLTLMVLAQLLIALFSIPLLALVWHDGFWGNWSWVLPLFLTAAGTTGGELMFFRAERSIAPSRLSSLLGLRVALLAIVSASIGIEHYNLLQCGGIVLAAASAFVMNYENGKLNFRGMPAVFGALAFYCLSDLSIKFMIDGIRAPSLWHSALIAVCAINLVIGTVLIPFIFLLRIRARSFTAAVPYAGTWFAKQLCLYICYAMVGPVFGNVVMTSRGPLAIILTLILLHFGVKNLEQPKALPVWIRRGVATLMMAAAIVLYSVA